MANYTPDDTTSSYQSPLDVDKPTLVHLAHSTSSTILWLLEELGVDYNLILIDRPGGDEPGNPALFNTHPLGKSPQLHLPGHRVITQVPAISLYLHATYDPSHRFHPNPSVDLALAVRDEEITGLAHSDLVKTGALKLVFILLSRRVPWPLRIIFDKTKDLIFSRAVDPDVHRHFLLLDGDLQGRDWFLCTSEPSRCDFVLHYMVDMFAQSHLVDMAQYPNLQAWLDRCGTRPAWKRALEKGNGYDLDFIARDIARDAAK